MGTEHEKIVLGSCYHMGLVYSLAYDANGETELRGETFTNLRNGFDGGAMAALKKHRRNFDPSRDVPLFIVSLKPVKIILGRDKDEAYRLSTGIPVCNRCEINDQVDDNEWCQECIDREDMCLDCGCLFEDSCGCWDEDDEDCNEYGCYCDLNDSSDFCDMCSCRFDDEDDEDEYDYEVHSTLGPLNPFTRARRLKEQGEL